MENRRFDALARALPAGHSRRGLGRFLSGLVLAVPFGLAGSTAVAAKKKGKKKKPTCRPVPDAAVVASYCFRGGVAGRVTANELGQPFIARHSGRLDRVDLTARDGPGGPFTIEIRDLNQGEGISSAPVLAAATVTVPAVAQGSETLVIARFATTTRLTNGFSYAIVIRFLGEGDSHGFRIGAASGCFDPGVVLRKEPGETTFTPIFDDRKLEHTVYVVP